jgi:hypothetical protein
MHGATVPPLEIDYARNKYRSARMPLGPCGNSLASWKAGKT